jgi:hypothetical protein
MKVLKKLYTLKTKNKIQVRVEGMKIKRKKKKGVKRPRKQKEL